MNIERFNNLFGGNYPLITKSTWAQVMWINLFYII